MDVFDGLKSVVQGQVHRDYPLAPHTTYQVGGPAAVAALPRTPADLASAVAWLHRQGVPFLVLGGGSNVLVSDQGVDGVVLVTSELCGVQVGGRQLAALAGTPSHRVAQAACDSGLAGAEFLSWLPGSIGGACFMNARAFGGEISQILTGARAVSPQGRLVELTFAASDFAYKVSPFQHNGHVLAEAIFQLEAGDSQAIAQAMDTIGRTRKDKHETDYPSCGCVFKNNRVFGQPSGKLIEACGLKGFCIGEAQVSPFHGNFVFNRGQATAAQIRQVIDHVQKEVARQTGCQLELEVQLWGRWEDA